MALGTISLVRDIKCPHCGANNRLDFSDNCEIITHEREMGTETMYEFDWDVDCVSCGQAFNVEGYICEYPPDAFNDEEINVK